ncbi:MAG: hypothetical protein Q8L53_16015 [Aestuariivirga sp.]|nr:hypothetical protein [Aestuariivirga sp.]
MNLVVQNVRCELLSATKQAWFIKEDPGWTVGLDLNVQVVNSAKGSANANLGIPLLPGTATPSIVAVHSGIADRSVTLGLKQDLSKPVPINCASDSSQQRLMLSSKLGIKEWLLEVQDLLVEQRQVDKKFSPRTVGTTIKFTVSSNGSAGSSFSLIPIGRSNLGGGVTLEASRMAVHTLIVALTKNQPPSEQRVIIVGDERGKTTKTAPGSSKSVNEERNDDAIFQELLRQKLLQ